MEIKVGETWMQGTLEGVDAQGGGRARVTYVRPVKVVCVEPCFVCVEELSKPAHPEYGHPRKWVPRGAFLGDIVLNGGSV